MRFYGFAADEVAGTTTGGMLDLEIDPKLSWALQNRDRFPVDVNCAPKEMLLRVPGFGTKSVQRILQARRQKTLRFDDVQRVGAIMSKAKPFITALDWSPRAMTDEINLRARFAPQPEQMVLL
jgi:predicted DNA-binding helix-hairpin-helix protein